MFFSIQAIALYTNLDLLLLQCWKLHVRTHAASEIKMCIRVTQLQKLVKLLLLLQILQNINLFTIATTTVRHIDSLPCFTTWSDGAIYVEGILSDKLHQTEPIPPENFLFKNSIHSHWLPQSHTTTNNETVFHQSLWAS